MPLVLDNSVACGWLFENQADDYTEAVARQLVDDHANAPAPWPMELANVLRTACRRGNLTAQHAKQMLEQVAQLPIEIDPKPARSKCSRSH